MSCFDKGGSSVAFCNDAPRDDWLYVFDRRNAAGMGGTAGTAVGNGGAGSESLRRLRKAFEKEAERFREWRRRVLVRLGADERFCSSVRWERSNDMLSGVLHSSEKDDGDVDIEHNDSVRSLIIS